MRVGFKLPIYDIELYLFEVSKSWPQEGLFYNFFYFWSHFSQSGWLLLFPLWAAWKKIGSRRFWIATLGAAAATGIGDLISRRVIKEMIMRPRPHFLNQSCLESKCWGFVSSHSANTAALVTFFCLLDRRNAYWGIPVLILVGSSRIYLQAHFLFDVIGGYLLGVCIGWAIFNLLKSKFTILKETSNRL